MSSDNTNMILLRHPVGEVIITGQEGANKAEICNRKYKSEIK